MKRLTFIFFLFASVIVEWGCRAEGDGKLLDHWPQWRGPLGTGVSPNGKPPIAWSEEKNLKWKIPLAGSGYATPVVWGDLLFILTGVNVESSASERKESGEPAPGGGRGEPVPESPIEYKVIALNRHDGALVWEKVATQEIPHEGIHRTGSWASGSPVTDGEHLIAFFGSRGVYCYDLSGNLVWKKDLGDMTIKRGFGEGTSPALHRDTLVINWDHEGDSFLVALNKSNGEELWRTPREERTSWSTPAIVEVQGRPQVIVNATHRARGYDLKTGEVIWEVGGMTDNVIPTPVVSNHTAFLTSGFRGNMLLAVDLATARGDISDSDAVLWKIEQDTPYVPSPLLYDDFLYYYKRNDDLLTCVDSRTGEVRFGPERLDGFRDVYASPVGAGGKIYLTGRNGVFQVIEKGPEFKVLATNRLEDEFSASPAIVGNDLYLRGHHHLYCVSETPTGTDAH